MRCYFYQKDNIIKKIFIKPAIILFLLLNLAACSTKTKPETEVKANESPSVADIDITGTWKGSMEKMGQSVNLGFSFKSVGSELTGTLTTPRGREFPVSEGRIDGPDVSFKVHVTGQPDIMISFRGKIIGKEINLTMQTDMPGMDKPSEVILKRVKAEAPSPSGDNRTVADTAFDEFINSDFYSLSKRFAPEAKALTTPEKLSQAISPMLRSLGSLKTGRPEPQVTNIQGYDVFSYPAEFEKTNIAVNISVNSAGYLVGLFMTQPKPEPLKQGELAVTSGDIKLPATLNLPEGKGPFPAVVLVHGSGPGDRDETVGANKPFLDLARGLANHGIATLRYVKRTRQYPLGGVVTVKDEVMDDALNAVALARSQPGIDPHRVFLLGHSLGAYLAPRIAEADKTIAGVIMLAGSVRPMLELAKDQLEYLNAPPDTLERLRSAAPPSYWEDLETYEPVATARRLEMPILILQGERDYQVTMKEFNLWKSGMQGRENVTFKSYQKLNHLFLEGEGKSLPAEYNISGHIPDYVFSDIADFINNTAQ